MACIVALPWERLLLSKVLQVVSNFLPLFWDAQHHPNICELLEQEQPKLFWSVINVPIFFFLKSRLLMVFRLPKIATIAIYWDGQLAVLLQREYAFLAFIKLFIFSSRILIISYLCWSVVRWKINVDVTFPSISCKLVVPLMCMALKEVNIFFWVLGYFPSEEYKPDTVNTWQSVFRLF